MAQNHFHIRLTRDNGTQVLHIPQELELPGDQVILREQGHRLAIEPIYTGQPLALLSTFDRLEEALPDVDADVEPLDGQPLQ